MAILCVRKSSRIFSVCLEIKKKNAELEYNSHKCVIEQV